MTQVSVADEGRAELGECSLRSPDGRTLYVTESCRATIYACDFDEGAGTVGHRRAWFRMDVAVGKPDGLLVEALARAPWSGALLTLPYPRGGERDG